MLTQSEAIIEAFRALGGIRKSSEIEEWVLDKYGARWKDFGTLMADMVPVSHGGNNTSNESDYFRVLQRVSRGNYRLIKEVDI
jgi:hypothetical protein